MVGRWKVLIVDDMEVFRRQIKRLSLWKDETPFELIAEASDGLEALKILQKTPVDLLITDIKMPRMDGLSLLREVRSKNLTNCVVFLSDYAEFSIAKEAIQLGIFDYLVKPVMEGEMKSLLQKVQAHLEKSEEEAYEKKQLVEQAFESISLYYPTADIGLIKEGILKGNESILEEVRGLVIQTWNALSKDRIRTGLVLDQSLQDILKGIEQDAPWIGSLYPLDSFYRIRASRHSDVKGMEMELVEVFGKILRKIRDLLPATGENPLVRDLQAFIILNIEEKLTLDRLAEKFYLTKNHLGEVFKEETGLTLGEYILRVKIERAKVLLREDFRTYEISEKLGYQSAEYFAKQFKKSTGETPSEYRKKMKKAEKID